MAFFKPCFAGLLLVSTSLCPLQARAQEVSKFYPPGAAQDGRYGHDVAVSGDMAIVGAPAEDLALGGAYFFQRQGAEWIPAGKADGWIGGIGDFFYCGFSVDISDDLAIVGCPAFYFGLTYVFERRDDEWIRSELIPADRTDMDQIGHSVAVSGDVAVVGAYGSDAKGGESGAVYVFERQDSVWVEVAKLTPSDGAAGDRFGYAVALEGDLLVAGAPQDDDNGENAGAVYAFERQGDTWIETSKRVAVDAVEGTEFGASLALSGDVLVVGAYLDDDRGEDAGAAYVFERLEGAWDEGVKLYPDTGAPEDRFGYAVDVSAGVLLVGAYLNDAVAEESGAAHLFERRDTSWVQTGRITQESAEARNRFGFSVGISGDNVLVGANKGRANGGAHEFNGTGTVQAFRRQGATWTLLDRTLAAGDATYDYFGAAVAISGDYAIIGATGFCDGNDFFESGWAFTFQRQGSEWEGMRTLTSTYYAVDCERFGRSVDISGGYAVVGASPGVVSIYRREETEWILSTELSGYGSALALGGDYLLVEGSGNEAQQGSAYVIRREGSEWNEAHKLVPDERKDEDQFGAALDISGDFALVGVPGDDHAGPRTGAAYVFRRQGDDWIQTKLTASNGAAEDRFGEAVALSGAYALVGAPGRDDAGSISGAVYIFERQGNAWVQTSKLTASDGAAEDRFGHAVSVSGDVAVVGAPYDDDNGDRSGAAYVFRRQETGWVEARKLFPNEGAEGDTFGDEVALSGDCVIVGAPGDDDFGGSSGSAYYFELSSDASCMSPDDPLSTSGDPSGPIRFPELYPNPFSQSMVLEYVLADAAHVTVAVYDVLGRQVQVLAEGPRQPGEHAFTWEADASLPAGLYLVRIMTDRGESRVLPVVKQ